MHINGNSVFGHTRLSIVDVAGGHQPILADGDRAGIICNGEIYNFREHKNRLSAEYSFKTKKEYRQIKRDNPQASINSREAAYYFKIFRQFHPQDSILPSIGIWKGFDFHEERRQISGTI
jgi:Glutamine amidotransferase domain